VDDQLREDLGRVYPVPFDPEVSSSARAMAERRPNACTDTEAPDVPEHIRRAGRAARFRSNIVVPLVRDDEGIGSIVLTDTKPGYALDGKQLSLLQTFADQAVIAIENVRLFNETKEALERQTATAEILKVIASSPSDVQPVFDAIAASALRLIGGRTANVTRLVGDELHLVAFTATSESLDEEFRKMFPSRVTGQGASGRAVLSGKPATVSDFETDAAYSPAFREVARARGMRSVVAVPMIREGEAIGTISVARSEAGNFTDHQIDLLKTFADQAVIAIENVRLFNETREALERQTATAEILKVISSSPTDTQPVFEAIVQSGLKLFPNSAVVVTLPDGDQVRLAAMADPDPVHAAQWKKRHQFPLTREFMHAVAILDRMEIDVPDAQAYEGGPLAAGIHNFLATGNRAITIVPMLRPDAVIGTISVIRLAPGPLTEKQFALLRTFADQAVIAIENVRLFKELQSRTDALTKSVGQLTALGEVGQAISSTLDLDTVLQTIVSRAVQLTGLNGGTIYEFDERRGEFLLRAHENMPAELVEVYRSKPIRLGEGVVGSAAQKREALQVPDIQDPGYQTRYRDLLIRQGYRAILAVPLLREEQIIGALTVSRNAPGEFPPEIVELLKTFATQSAMAIQNARLFREIAEKGKQLELASQHKSNFLASMSHELRTPLNAILGFNEMILGQVYGEVPADMQEPLNDIQTSGKHLLRLINNVLDLAKIEAGRMELSLQDYSVHDTVGSVHSTLRPLAADKGLEFLATVPNDVPLAYGDGGRITQCLMNLAGNSIKFTKAGKVEISAEEKDGLLTYRVADTGIGIPPDKIDSLFTEFKQTDATIASEYGGTGLGLSISKKFVEMHGGRIWIESELGKGSTFIIEVPLRVNTK
jgi:signal transduction histidine kinase